MKEILRIGLLDDEDKPRNLIAAFIAGMPGYSIAFSTDNPYLALRESLDRKIDILVTDIAMPGMTGLQLSKEIKHLDIPVIMCSVHEKHGVDGYRLNTVDFVRKPPRFLEVSNALDKARTYITKLKDNPTPPDEDFVMLNLLKYSRYIMLIPSQVHYLEQKNIDTKVMMDSGELIEFRSSLTKALAEINRPFIVRVHRSYALNYYKIKSMDQAYCYMSSGIRIPIGNEYRKDFMEYLKFKRL